MTSSGSTDKQNKLKAEQALRRLFGSGPMPMSPDLPDRSAEEAAAYERMQDAIDRELFESGAVLSLDTDETPSKGQSPSEPGTTPTPSEDR